MERAKAVGLAERYNDADSLKSTTGVTKYMKTRKRKRKTRNKHDVENSHCPDPHTTL